MLCRITSQWRRNMPATCRTLLAGGKIFFSWLVRRSTDSHFADPETCPGSQPRGSARRSARSWRGCATLWWCTAGTTVRSTDRELDISQWCYFTFVLLTSDVKFCFWSTLLNLPPAIILIIQPFKMTRRQETDDRENCEARVRDHPSAHWREPSPGEAANHWIMIVQFANVKFWVLNANDTGTYFK